MIAIATSVSYGGNAIRYSTRKEDADIVKIHKLPEGLSATTMWKMMEAAQLKFRAKLNRHRPLVNTLIKIEVSPSREETAGWTLEDWVKLSDDFIREFDAVDLSGKTGRASAKSTNLRNSQYVVMLHHDSDSGILHLHITANRIDMDGHINDDHFIHERAMQAANKVTEDRKWVQAKTIQEQNIRQIYKDCISILDQMDSFSWDHYERDLRMKGYGIEFRRDSSNQITGYTILKGNSRYKSSLLGPSRDITPSRIQDTWKELHPASGQQWKPTRQPETPSVVAPKKKKITQPKPEEKRKPLMPAKVLQKITVNEKEYSAEIPETVFNFFKGNSVVPDNTLRTEPEHILQTAILLFANFVDGATAIADNCGGAGSSATDDWGKKKLDEDDMAFAKRCLARARQLHVRPPRRGWHR